MYRISGQVIYILQLNIRNSSIARVISRSSNARSKLNYVVVFCVSRGQFQLLLLHISMQVADVFTKPRGTVGIFFIVIYAISALLISTLQLEGKYEIVGVKSKILGQLRFCNFRKSWIISLFGVSSRMALEKMRAKYSLHIKQRMSVSIMVPNLVRFLLIRWCLNG